MPCGFPRVDSLPVTVQFSGQMKNQNDQAPEEILYQFRKMNKQNPNLRRALINLI
jgi:hypothetical protein